MTCQDFDDQFDAYARGALRDDAATALEQHAADCAVCASRLERLPQIDVSMYMPALPSGVRDATLAAIRRKPAISVRGRWIASAILAAAAALAFVTLPEWRRSRAAAYVAAPQDTLVRTGPAATTLATDRAKTEFQAIDAAERELLSAIAVAPDDAQLRAFLTSVKAQREELRRRVEAAHT
ncbi:MAG: zf-HC2 domain-containing protein [Gemmatimonadaceae bacterium]|nr:zf-HC2 domain-containing protein [Gemmatimonadaceae bacterium]